MPMKRKAGEGTHHNSFLGLFETRALSYYVLASTQSPGLP